MKNMKIKKSEKEAAPTSVAPDRPDYPYGLCVRLGKDELTKLGIKGLPAVGDSFMIEAKSFVKTVSASAGEGGDYASVELQITDMGLDSDSEDKKAKTAKSLFGDMASKKDGPNS